jgi:hypothetical protein
MLELLKENAAFRSRAQVIISRYQIPTREQVCYSTFDIFKALDFSSALLVLDKVDQARQVFAELLQQVNSLFVDYKRHIFEESLYFENSDPLSLGIVCTAIRSCVFIAILTRNNELIDAIDESVIDGEFISEDGIKVYDGNFRFSEYVLRLHSDIKAATRFRIENWDDWVEFDEACDYDVDWKFFLPVENNNLNELLNTISQYNSDSAIELSKGLLHPYNYSFSRNVLGFIEAVAMRMLEKQLQPDEHYPSFGIDKLL